MRVKYLVFGVGSVALIGSFLVGCDRGSKQAQPSTESATVERANPVVKQPAATCASQTAVAAIQGFIADGVEARAREENKGASEDRRLDLSKVRAIASQTKIELQDVLTSKNDPNSTKRFCEATLSMSLSSDEIEKADELRRRNGLNSIKSVAEDAGFKVDVNKFTKRASYSVQPTDDGSKIFVSLEGGSVYVTLAGEATVWAAAYMGVGQVKATSAANANREQTTSQTPQVSLRDQEFQDELARSIRRFNAAEREVNVVWKALPKAVRDAHLVQQRQFNNEKESSCFRKASDAGSGARFEIAKNNCWADMYDKRTPELKALN
jgi:Lysozyme inhibitor LprI